VICRGHFNNDFPIGTMRKDVEVLKITPDCLGRPVEEEYESLRRRLEDKEFHCPVEERRKNKLSLGPNFQYLRLLKVTRGNIQKTDESTGVF
jgi:hypothetical protein